MATEKRLIDANVFECVCVNGKSDDFCNGVLYVLDMIDAQPTVDAVEVVHGRWERMDTRYVEQFKCSVCRSECYVPTCMGEPMYDYCPNCGAKMDGGSNETD